ncbi:MAG: sulfite exporter TauE/SafE family protein [Proteobacteria bacterium]|nr:sulfite exporter TauE/SafE family protein [Pseudomonadota bacterium]
MSVTILIATSFSLGFFVESIIGFGGGLIAYAILGFFMDLKEMILCGLYIGTCSSTYIAYTDYKAFNKKIFLNLLPFCLTGTILGVLIFSKFSSQSLSLTFGILLILLAIKTIFFDKISFPKFFRNQLIFIGGICHGAFGIGGPFFVNALKNNFKNKSELRTTMAVVFVFFNLIRFLQLGLQNQIKADFFIAIWWVVIPVFAAIKLGHLVHLKVSEEIFKKCIGLMTIFAGLKFLVKTF